MYNKNEMFCHPSQYPEKYGVSTEKQSFSANENTRTLEEFHA